MRRDAVMLSMWHDAHGPTVAVLDPKPSRVLDVACGVHAHWVVHTAQQPGWEHTRFVALDLAPSLVPAGLLPRGVRGRVAFVQHNVLDPGGLPFFDDEFDFVRVGCVNSAVPGASSSPSPAAPSNADPPSVGRARAEHAWDRLVEECRRVLKPGHKLEVLDTLFSLYMPRPLPTIIDACERIVRARFITLALHTAIPPALAMNELRCTRTVKLPVLQAPARPPTVAAGPGADGEEDVEVRHARILLHLWSQRIGAHALPLARAVEATYRAEAPSGALRGAKESAAAEKDSERAILEWTGELREIAGLASVMEREWGWECAFDRRLEGKLASRVPVMERELGARRGRQQRNGGSSDAGRSRWSEAALQQLEAQKREAEQELGLVRRRLRLVPMPRPSERETMGIFGGEAWISTKRVDQM